MRVNRPDMNAYSASRLDALPPLREVIAEYGLGARRSLGQHFLLDLNLTRRIANAATYLEDGTVVEVGQVLAANTILLSAGASRLIAIERDDRCIEALSPLQAASVAALSFRTETLWSSISMNWNRDQSALSPTCPTMSQPRCLSIGCVWARVSTK